MAESVVIKDGKAESISGGGVSIGSDKGTAVKLTSANDYTENSKSVTKHFEGEATHESRGSERQTSGDGGSANVGDIRDPQGKLCRNMKEVTDKHSIILENGIECSMAVAELNGWVVRDGSGEIFLRQQDSEEVQKEQKTPLHTTENLKTHSDQEQLNALNAKVSPAVTDAFMGHMIGALVDDGNGQGALSDYSQASGASEESVHEFANNYLTNLLNAGIDYAVRTSKGTLTSAEIEEHLPKLSKGYQKSLLLSLHHNNLTEAKNLISIVKQKKII
jgi:hypothetical protein